MKGAFGRKPVVQVSRVVRRHGDCAVESNFWPVKWGP